MSMHTGQAHLNVPAQYTLTFIHKVTYGVMWADHFEVKFLKMLWLQPSDNYALQPLATSQHPGSLFYIDKPMQILRDRHVSWLTYAACSYKTS